MGLGQTTRPTCTLEGLAAYGATASRSTRPAYQSLSMFSITRPGVTSAGAGAVGAGPSPVSRDARAAGAGVLGRPIGRG